MPPPSTPPPPAGPPPAGGGFAPPSGPHPPAQHTPPTYAGLPGYPPPPPGYAPPAGSAPPALAPDGRPLAGFGERLVAWLIDTLIASAVTMVLFAPVLVWLVVRMIDQMPAPGPDGTVTGPDPSALFTDFFLPVLVAELGIFAVLLVFYWLYHVEYARRTGQTLGKKVMKLRIVPLEPGATLTRGVLGKRYLVEFVAGSLVPFLSYVDGFWQLWDKPWQQCLHDKAAGTVVVKVAP
ncbi:RDD family protein [Micromonospora sp. PPF5-17]|uniref:RDD family protein n=1 Tax=Micromonospora solifontis TaxID=2487138 RepID=A0ABX9WHR3_9ACTN|nr:RDD family protein [Micromonospora sp. PPF5-17B]NES36636.1 RDD family protein [Micromonospora solifontis]NES55662.1 RDD family protein [Micromonospora sp. PPF5-6]RNL99281.1 RDD family protein [Micromonospora solifontis]